MDKIYFIPDSSNNSEKKNIKKTSSNLVKTTRKNKFRHIISQWSSSIIYYIVLIFIIVFIIYITRGVIYTRKRNKSVESQLVLNNTSIEYLTDFKHLSTGDLILIYYYGKDNIRKVASFIKFFSGSSFKHCGLIIYDKFNHKHYVYEMTRPGIKFTPISDFVNLAKSNQELVMVKPLQYNPSLKFELQRQIVYWTNMQQNYITYYSYGMYKQYILKILTMSVENDNLYKNKKIQVIHDKNKYYQKKDDIHFTTTTSSLTNSVFIKNDDKITCNNFNTRKRYSTFITCTTALLEIYNNSNIINLDNLWEYQSWIPLDFLLIENLPWINPNKICFSENLYILNVNDLT